MGRAATGRPAWTARWPGPPPAALSRARYGSPSGASPPTTADA
jgi:hypothetical protein